MSPVTKKLVYEELAAHGPSTKREVQDAVPANRKTVARALRKLHTEKRIFVQSWIDSEVDERSYPRPLWAVGPGIDAVKPKPLTGAQRATLYRAAQKQRPDRRLPASRWITGGAINATRNA